MDASFSQSLIDFDFHERRPKNLSAMGRQEIDLLEAPLVRNGVPGHGPAHQTGILATDDAFQNQPHRGLFPARETQDHFVLAALHGDALPAPQPTAGGDVFLLDHPESPRYRGSAPPSAASGAAPPAACNRPANTRGKKAASASRVISSHSNPICPASGDKGWVSAGSSSLHWKYRFTKCILPCTSLNR